MDSATNSRTARTSRKRWRLTPRFWSVVAAAFVFYMGISYVTGFTEIWRLKTEIGQIQNQIAAVEVRNEELRREIAYLRSDEYIEKVAREELGLVKPGETAVIIASPKTPDSSP